MQILKHINNTQLQKNYNLWCISVCTCLMINNYIAVIDGRDDMHDRSRALWWLQVSYIGAVGSLSDILSF